MAHSTKQDHLLISVVLLVLFAVMVFAFGRAAEVKAGTCAADRQLCEFTVTSLSKALDAIPEQSVETPEWMLPKVAPPPAGPNRPAGERVVSYSVEPRNVNPAAIGAFAAQANQTLNNGRGWAKLGLRFQQVPTGGSFTLVLASAASLPQFSSGCSVEWSCRAGRYVIINQDRWNGATAAWNGAGGNLSDYRHMVLNHEVGHWLGHDHASCPGAGQLAPLMQQQSISLQGCKFNPWPLPNELSAPNLGI